MKTIYKFIVLLSLVFSYSSCDYLDVVPDEVTTVDDTFADEDAARDYLYSCYGYLPQANVSQFSLDQMTGDEVITAFEHETFAAFPKGNYSASNTVISYWDTFFQGLRQCYMFLNILDKVPYLSDDKKADYVGQAKFLIAYYHYMMARCYGPIILVKKEPLATTPIQEYLGRTSYDECVEWICNLFDEAANALPPSRNQQSEYGLATSVAAKALKAKMLLYAASPLFNKESPKLYADFVDKTGTHLMPTVYDPNKWEKAKVALKEAIDLAELNGHDLYRKQDYLIGAAFKDKNQYPEQGPVRCLRFTALDWENANPEVLFAETRGEGFYGVQNKSLPYVSSGLAWNGTGLTWAMLNRFYTKNGLPWDEDPEYKNLNKLALTDVDSEHADQAAVGVKTILFNLDREPRYYAWVGFQGGYFEVLNRANKPAYGMDDTGSRLVCDFVLGGNCSRGTVADPRPGNYSPSGYLNKKFVNPNTTVGTDGVDLMSNPWPVVRLADLYLAYAEACVETGGNDLATAKTYLNYVRDRAGIPSVETAWAKVPGVTLNQDKLREIVRQERMNELYLECQNFWDMRRWMLAETKFAVKAQGMNISASTVKDFAQLTTINFERKFTAPTQYLLPLPLNDVSRNPQLINNPGY